MSLWHGQYPLITGILCVSRQWCSILPGFYLFNKNERRERRVELVRKYFKSSLVSAALKQCCDFVIVMYRIQTLRYNESSVVMYNSYLVDRNCCNYILNHDICRGTKIWNMNILSAKFLISTKSFHGRFSCVASGCVCGIWRICLLVGYSGECFCKLWLHLDI